MALSYPVFGAHVLDRGDFDCKCGNPFTHVVLRPIHMDGQTATDLNVHLRGYCNRCSPVNYCGVYHEESLSWWDRVNRALFYK